MNALRRTATSKKADTRKPDNNVVGEADAKPSSVIETELKKETPKAILAGHYYAGDCPCGSGKSYSSCHYPRKKF